MTEPRQLLDGRRLFRLDYIVRLSDDHPMRSVAEGGKLIIWTYQREITAAVMRADYFFKSLPFQRTDAEIEWDDTIIPDNEAYELLVDMADRIGFATFFQPDEQTPKERGMTPKAAA